MSIEASLDPPPEHAPPWFSAAVAMSRSAHAVLCGSLHLHLAGWNDAEGGKPPLLLVHGFRAHAHWWDHIAPFLVPQHRVYALDLSGMGLSARREAYTRQGFTDDILAAARWLKERAPRLPLVVVGHSYGGSRLLDACAQVPGLIDHAIVLDAPLPAASVVERRRSPQQPAEPGTDRDAILARFRLSPEQPALSFVRSYIAERSIAAVRGGGWRWRFDPAVMTAIGGIPEPTDAYRRVDVPVAIVRGECSSIVGPAMAERMASLLPKARGPFVLAGAHHHLMLDQPLALVALLRSLLAGQAPVRGAWGAGAAPAPLG